MPENLNILFLAAEAEPLIKVGGLGDVAGSLPRALRGLPADVRGDTVLDVRLALPLHNAITPEAFGFRPLTIFPLRHTDVDLEVHVLEGNLDGLPVYLIGGDPIRSSGSVYSSNPALDAEKYTFFSLAALELTRQIGWKPQIVHANDWHTALAAYALMLGRREESGLTAASVLTLHNLPFMGPDVSANLMGYGLALTQTGLPEWARPLPLPLGLWAADSVVAVSPSYAREILTPDFGCGLQDYIHARGAAFTGILNGLDVESFNPATDVALGANYGPPTLERRAANKSALQVRLGLAPEEDIPLFGVVSRLDRQKGIDLIPAALRKLKDLRWQAVLLGAGDPKLEGSLRRLQEDFPDRVRAEFKYDAGLARQIYAGADIFLMPSRYEPCGLSQMIAMRYGCVPLVSAVGGLRDTVTPDTGFLFSPPTTARFATAIKAALKVFKDSSRWESMQRAGMSRDFSWANSAREYLGIYQRLKSKSTVAGEVAQ
jgi:starch synthase